MPAWARTSLDDYEARLADGEITFHNGEFADEPADTRGGWVGSLLADHLPALDV
jgi:hypothetical protein